MNFPQSTGSLSSKYWLSLSPQPPRHPFVNVWFPIKVFLVDSKKSLKSGWPLRLSVELLYEVSERSEPCTGGDAGLLLLLGGRRRPRELRSCAIVRRDCVRVRVQNGEVVPNQSACVEVQGCSEDKLPALGPNGSVDLKVRVLTVSMAHENKVTHTRHTLLHASRIRASGRAAAAGLCVCSSSPPFSFLCSSLCFSSRPSSFVSAPPLTTRAWCRLTFRSFPPLRPS